MLRNFPGSFDSYDCALARALGLEYVVLDRPIENVPRLAKRPVAETLVDGPRLWIYRLKNTMPRVALSDRIQVADADATNAAGQLLFPPSADRVLVDEDTPPRRAYATAGEMREPARARIVAWAPDRVEIETRSQAGGVLVLHATYYPGWRAEIDGRPAPVLRANVLFRGVEVPAGLHRVVFRFAPFALDNLRDALRVALHGAR
ncbi:MAG: YfhO family protein [Pseudorhodoplanes sp.]|nr:YfhO family protein [Pseudorhodoplanes sp.]